MQTAAVQIRRGRPEDAEWMDGGFRAGMGWAKSDFYFVGVLDRHTAGAVEVLVAEDEATYLGHLMVTWSSAYEAFRDRGIPEVNDLNVVAPARRRGLASKLMDEAERLIASRSWTAGIGVGVYADYGPAQRLYVRRYVPDGAGILSHHVPVRPGEPVVVDDDLVLYLTKNLSS